MKTKTLRLLTSLAVALTLLTGCVAPLLLVGVGAAGAVGAVSYTRGELKSMQAVTLDKAYETAQAMITDMSFTLVKKTKDAITATLEARGLGDKKIAVSLRRLEGNLTEIRIRVAIFGDEDASRQMLEKMKNHF